MKYSVCLDCKSVFEDINKGKNCPDCESKNVVDFGEIIKPGFKPDKKGDDG